MKTNHLIVSFSVLKHKYQLKYGESVTLTFAAKILKLFLFVSPSLDEALYKDGSIFFVYTLSLMHNKY